MALLDQPAAVTASLMSDEVQLALTAEQFVTEVMRIANNADRADFARGPYVYSVTVLERGEGGTTSDRSAVYHDQLHSTPEDEVRAALQALLKPDAKLDVSLRRSSSHQVEHKTVTILHKS